MSLTLEKIEATISTMDQTYDANFGEWIRNEENSKIIAYHLKKYTSEYPSHDFVVVLKWIVKDWTLRSIIILTKMLIISEIDKSFDHKMDILQGLIFTWHSSFIAEFIISTSKMLRDANAKKSYIVRLLDEFDQDQIHIIHKEIGDKMEQKFRKSIFEEIKMRRHRKKNSKRKRLLDAFKIL